MSATLICTDSSAQLPAALVERLSAIVVPMSIAVAGRTFDEPELDVDEFYVWLAAGLRVTTSTSAGVRIRGRARRALHRLDSRRWRVVGHGSIG